MKRRALSIASSICLAAAAGIAAFASGQEEPRPKLNIAEALGLEKESGQEGEKVSFSGSFQLVEGTQKGTLILTARIETGWHIFSITQQKGGPLASKIKVSEAAEFKLLGSFQADRLPHVKTLAIYKVPVEEHEGEVTWSAPIEIAEGIDPETLTITMTYNGQVCAESCIPIFGKKVEAKFAGYGVPPPRVSPEETARATAATPEPGTTETGNQTGTKPLGTTGLLIYAAVGLLGGIILNFMPCVLPTVGIKILSFAQQGGQRRSRVFALNFSFFIGLMVVFLTLATLATGANLLWGEQFTHTWFKVAMIVVTFAMALSFLGVWEIPIPGFSSSGGTTAAEEGLTGAFLKGILATLLATPCSGPLLGPLWLYAGTSPTVAYVLFGSIGVGMGLPYLAIGAFPHLVRWLPKPGAWMETFKQLMGFVLLFTVVYFFASVPSYYIPTLATMIGVWFACWWIGRVPIYDELPKQAWAWIGGCAAAALIGWASFSLFGPKSEEEKLIAWQPYSAPQLVASLNEGKTVMIDFTANWCLTCQYNSQFAIETPKVKELIERNGVVPFLADWTEYSPEIKEKLIELKSRSIPLLAIYPAGRPAEVVVLRDVISETQLLEALEKAGPSKPAAATTSAAPPPEETAAVAGR
jgi:thiol:disulfide interchange protein